MLHCDKEFIVPVQIAVTAKALLLKNQTLLQQIQPTGSSTWEENFQMNKINSTLHFVINKVYI